MALPSYAMNVSSFPELYEEWLVEPLFKPFAEQLLDRVALHAGDRVLDIACGTGIVARLARERLGPVGDVVGVDVSAPMLAVARKNAPGIDWREGNATALPVADGETFDVIVCQQGLQFVPDKTAAASEIRRVLAPAGRVAVATWRPAEEIPLFRELQRVAERHLGAFVDARHSFGESDPLQRLLVDAGLQNVTVEASSRIVRFDDPNAFVRLNTMAIVGMSAASKTMSDEQRARVVSDIMAESSSVLPPFVDNQGFAFEIRTNVATARG